MEAIDQFAAEAIRFEAWALGSEPDPGLATRAALERLASLYLSALQLPSPYMYSEDLDENNDPERVSTADLVKIVACHSIPFDYYSEIFDPHEVPAQEAVIGSLSDDILDIYRDVITGLRAYRDGNRAESLREWGFSFANHWGEHATSAIRALHMWLVSNDSDRLSIRELGS